MSEDQRALGGAGGLQWFRSTRSGPDSPNCIEGAWLAGGRIALRDSRNRGARIIVVDAATWRAFLHALHGDELD